MRCLERANSQRQKAEERRPGSVGRENGSYCLMATEFQSGKNEKLWRCEWWRLHNTVSAPEAAADCAPLGCTRKTNRMMLSAVIEKNFKPF